MQAAKKLIKRWVFPVPKHLTANHIPTDAAKLAKVKESLAKNYHQGWRSKDSYHSQKMYEGDVQAMSIGRLGRYRDTYLPWIDATRRLKGLNVLEVGCGTGASTVAMAEQGAFLTAIDIDEGALQVAKDRRDIYGVSADIRLLNASEIKSLGMFDAIIYNACLEHMTIAERLQSLRDGWHMLNPNGIIVIVETPNRLWWKDTHTSKLPLYHWLPDELAYQCAKYSERDNFRDLYTNHQDPESMHHFLRRGRGMSFHELDVAIGRIYVGAGRATISSLHSYMGWRDRLLTMRHDKNLGATFLRTWIDRTNRKLLRLIYPNLHDGWFEEYLHVILRKS